MAKLSKKISNGGDFLKSITRLHEQIVAAETLLRKLPGSRSEQAKIWFKDLFQTDDPNDMGSNLEFTAEAGICVRHHYCDKVAGIETSQLKQLQEFPTIVRIEIAKRIPELIQISKAAVGKVAADAESVADSIEQAIAEHRVHSKCKI